MRNQYQQRNQPSITHLIAGFAIVLVLAWLRIFYFQVVTNKQLETRSINNFVRTNKVDVLRGDIIDNNGHILATSRLVMSLYWQGTGNNRLNQHQLEILHELAHLAPISYKKDLSAQIAHVERNEKTYRLAKDISFEQVSRIAERFAQEPNVLIKSHFKRHYPLGTMACHFIGYLVYQDVETHAKMGLECLYHDQLKGDPGIAQYMVNATGKSLTTHTSTPGTAGKTLKTTIDLHLQQLAEQVFSTDLAGCVIIMDPKTGAIRVLISRPGFDPAIFLKPIKKEFWAELQIRKPFLNRACNACYPPASLFKLITISAALEQKIIAPDAHRVCVGYTTYCNRKYHCHHREGHGWISFEESLAQSCDIIFYDIGKRIHIDTLADYANRYGLGKPTGIAFPEKSGLVPSSEWKREHKGERWWQGETLSAAIGQTYLLVTPMQIARMLGAISQGYLVKPRLLEDEVIEQEPLEIKNETLAFLKRAMRLVTKVGTAKILGTIPDLIIYGKTGTAQVVGLKEGETCGRVPEHGWFIANFSYKNSSPLTMVMFVEHGGSSRSPTKIAYQFLKGYRQYMQQAAD